MKKENRKRYGLLKFVLAIFLLAIICKGLIILDEEIRFRIKIRTHTGKKTFVGQTYTVEYPETWYGIDQMGNPANLSASFHDARNEIGIWLSQYREEGVDYTKLPKKQYEEENDVEYSIEEIKIDGHDAVRIATIKDEERRIWESIRYIIAAEPIVYELSYNEYYTSATAEEFEEIVKSFRVTFLDSYQPKEKVTIEEVRKHKVEEHSFKVELEPWGKVEFVSCQYEEEPYQSTSFYLVKGEEVLYQFPYVEPDNISTMGKREVENVWIEDFDGDGKKEVVISEYCKRMHANTERKIRVYEQEEEEFVYNGRASYSLLLDYWDFETRFKKEIVYKINRGEIQSGFQTEAMMDGENAYLFLNGAIYYVDTSKELKKVIKVLQCEDAVGYGGRYWAVWNGRYVRIIRFDEGYKIFEIGKIESEVPVAALDFHGGNKLSVRYKLGGLEQYSLDDWGRIIEKVPDEDIAYYTDENKAAKLRKENPKDVKAILKYPEHVMPAEYSIRYYGAEFLKRKIPGEEVEKEEFIVRKERKDEVLFTYYEQAYIYGDKVIYYGSPDKNKLMICDLEKKESQELYSFTDGSFQLVAVENGRIYGIWNSITERGNYFIGLKMKDLQITTYFTAEEGIDYAVLDDIAYYVNKETGELEMVFLLP